MKTKDFISKMNEVAGDVKALSGTGIHIYNLAGEKVGWVSINEFGVVDMSYTSLDTMKNKEKIVKLLFEYALTPLNEREDEPKFGVRMLVNYDNFLNQDRRNKDIFLAEPDETDNRKTIFTKSEYEKLQQKYHNWLPKFDENDPHFEFVEEKQ